MFNTIASFASGITTSVAAASLNVGNQFGAGLAAVNATSMPNVASATPNAKDSGMGGVDMVG